MSCGKLRDCVILFLLNMSLISCMSGDGRDERGTLCKFCKIAWINRNGACRFFLCFACHTVLTVRSSREQFQRHNYSSMHTYLFQVLSGRRVVGFSVFSRVPSTRDSNSLTLTILTAPMGTERVQTWSGFWRLEDHGSPFQREKGKGRWLGTVFDYFPLHLCWYCCPCQSMVPSGRWMGRFFHSMNSMRR